MEGALKKQAPSLGVLHLWAYAKDAAGGNIRRENNFENPV